MDAPSPNYGYGQPQAGLAFGPPSGFKTTRAKPTANQAATSTNTRSAPIVHQLPPLDALHDTDQIRPYWQIYIDLIRERGEMAMIGLLSSRQIEIEYPDIIIVPITGTIEESILVKGKEDMTLKMRQLTGISTLSIRPSLVAETNDGKRPYTQDDKFQVLLQKHPVLNLLRQSFNIDFDY
jgi:hypothetical protein